MEKLKRTGRLLVLFLCGIIALHACKDDPMDSEPGESENSNRYGLIKVTENDYTGDVSKLILQDNEAPSVMFSEERTFNVNKPLQVSINEQQELFLRFYSPRSIRNVIIWAKITGYEEQFKLAEFDVLPAFMEFHKKLPIVDMTKRYITKTGKEIEIVANPRISGADMTLEIECADLYYQKIISTKCHFKVVCSPYSLSGSWQYPMLLPHAREAVAISLNMAYMFSSAEFATELEKFRGKLFGGANNTSPVDIDQLLTRTINYAKLTYGHCSGVNGLGGPGGTFGLNEWCYLEHYADDKAITHTIFHEFGHCLGYGHDGNMTYGDGWTDLCGRVYIQLSKDKQLPVYSRRFMHTRKNKNRYDKTNLYIGSAYIIEDSELDAIDGGLGLLSQEDDDEMEKGTALACNISYSQVPGATDATFTPKDVCVFGNKIYIVNDAPNNYSLEVFEEQNGQVKHLKSVREWIYNGMKQQFAGVPTGVTVAHGKIYVTNMGSRTDVFDERDFSFITCIGTGEWGEGKTETVHAFDPLVRRGCVFIRDKRRICIFKEEDVEAKNYQNIYKYSQTTHMGEDNGTYGLALNKQGELFATHQNAKKIFVYDLNTLRVQSELKPARIMDMPVAVYDVATVDNRVFITINRQDRFVEINPKTGEVIKDYTKVAGQNLQSAEKINFSRQTLFVVDRAAKKVVGIPVSELK